MVMSWQNGDYNCAQCGNGVDESCDLTAVIGGVEADYIETAPGQYKLLESYYSVLVCPVCYRREIDAVALRLLTW
jgi:hypothetical protein